MIHLPPRSHKNSTTEIRLHIEGYGLCGRYLISPGVKGAYAVREPQMPKGVEHMAKITKDIGRATGIPNFSCYRGRHRMIAGHTKAETTLAYASRRALRALTGREVRNFQRRSFEPPQPPATTETGATVVVNLLAGSVTIDAGTGI